MRIARAVPNAYKLEPIITDDLLLARDILRRLKDPVAQRLDKAQTHLGSIVHGIPLKPARGYSDKKSIVYIADVLREASFAILVYGFTPLSILLPPSQSEEEYPVREKMQVIEEKGERVVSRRERTAWDLSCRLRQHADYLQGLLRPSCRIPLAPSAKTRESTL